MALAPRKTEPAPDQLDSIIDQLTEVVTSLSTFSSNTSQAETDALVTASDNVGFSKSIDEQLKIIKLYLAELTNEEFEASDIKD